ncbi:MAG: preprotein translocase subunit SecG [Phycisphaerales bacterium]
MDLSLLAHTTLAQSTPTLAMSWSPVVTNILVGVFLIVSIAMILLVLIKRPQGGGLSGAFGAGGGGGGGGAGQTAFGTKTGDVLTGATITFFVLFLVTAIVLNFATRPAEPSDNVPTLTTPAGETDPDGAEEVETTPIDDAEQAIDDVMDSETSVEGDVEDTTGEPATSDEPAAGSEPGTDEPAADED